MAQVSDRCQGTSEPFCSIAVLSPNQYATYMELVKWPVQIILLDLL
jgi:hypothetical protein